MTLNFRTATTQDLSVIVRMLADDDLGSKREDPSVPLSRSYQMAFEAIDADPNNELVVADKLRPDAVRFYQRLGFVASHEGMKLRV